MARYLGPKCKLSRREGTDLFLKIGVNCELVTITSYQCKGGDVVAIREKSQKQLRIQSALQIKSQVGFPDWVEVDEKKLSGVLKQLPDREDILPDINENLVVELYS